MKSVLGIVALAAALLLAAACSSPAPSPTPPPPPKAAATTAPKPAVEKPAAAAPAKPAAEKPAAKAEAKAAPAGPAQKLAEKPGAAPIVSPAINAKGLFAPSDTLILYGDLALFAGRDNPENCVLRSRYTKGEGVGFRMTAIDPVSGKFSETAEVLVKIPSGGKIETLEMRYRGTGDNPRPGFWTAKWVVPDDAAPGVIKYWIEAKDKDGRTAMWQPYNIEGSMLTIVP